MINKLLVIFLIGLAFFFGLTVGKESSPSQSCINWKEYFSERYFKTYDQLTLCQSSSYRIMEEFYDYEDGLWKLKKGLQAWRAWTKEWQDFWNTQEIEEKIKI